ncbi:MAG: DUF4860 domain-containing protein [Erysipelotrichaceae bacterium]
MKSYKKSSINALFIIIIIGVLSLSMLVVANLGSVVYRKIVLTMDENFNYYTSLNYIKEKVYQNDEADCIKVESINGSNILVIDNKNNIKTYIYFYEEYLKELIVLKGQTIDFEAGENIVKLNEFKIKLENNLLYLSIYDSDQIDLIIHLSSRESNT